MMVMVMMIDDFAFYSRIRRNERYDGKVVLSTRTT